MDPEYEKNGMSSVPTLDDLPNEPRCATLSTPHIPDPKTGKKKNQPPSAPDALLCAAADVYHRPRRRPGGEVALSPPPHLVEAAPILSDPRTSPRHSHIGGVRPNWPQRLRRGNPHCGRTILGFGRCFSTSALEPGKRAHTPGTQGTQSLRRCGGMGGTAAKGPLLLKMTFGKAEKGAHK